MRYRERLRAVVHVEIDLFAGGPRRKVARSTMQTVPREAVSCNGRRCGLTNRERHRDGQA